jgi:prepilin-type N-terminal cleavage/methylation domain-containing protein
MQYSNLVPVGSGTSPLQTRAKQAGFTLVEMAIVLAVIGLILGAVMIGKDIQRNAEYTKVKQKFVDQWVVAYNAHYQRTGVPVGDSQVEPQLMVNGQAFVDANNSSGGDMSNVDAPAAVCADNEESNLRDLMLAAGIEMPPGRGEGSEDRYVYLDTNGNPQEIQVCFRWNPPGTNSGSGNVMEITGLTPDLARFLDQAVDGQADAWEGNFRQEGIETGNSSNQAGRQWNANNTFGLGDDQSEDAIPATDDALDEEQIITLTAHYKMNQ